MNFLINDYLRNFEFYHAKIGITGKLYNFSRSVLLEKFKKLGFYVIDTDKNNVNLMNLDFLKIHLIPGKIIGITGPSGAGKTTLCKRLKKLYDNEIISADDIAHYILNINGDLKSELVEHFGTSIIEYNSVFLKINRSNLKHIVLSSEDKLIKFNKIIFKYLAKEIISNVQKSLKDDNIVILDAPLLLEYSLDKICDTVVVLIYGNNRSRWKL